MYRVPCMVFCRDIHIMPWLVFEYMEHGDLSEILRANSGIFSQMPPTDSAALKEGIGPPKVGLVSQVVEINPRSHMELIPKLFNLWWMPNSVSKGRLSPSHKTEISRSCLGQIYPTTYICVSGQDPTVGCGGMKQ